MTELRTEEEIKAHIALHWSTWDICEELSVKETLTEKQEEKLNRNKEHIQRMLKVDWFIKGCTAEELEKFKKYE